MIKVMLVDDKELIIDGLEMLIDWNELGYEIAAKTISAAEAIEIARTQQIDLVITDIRMPEMSGMEMITQISQISPDTKFIFESAYSEFEYAKWAIDKQIAGYLLKPIVETELIAILKRLKTEIEKSLEMKRQNMDNIYMNALMGNVSEDNPDNKAKNPIRYIVMREVNHKILSDSTLNSHSKQWSIAAEKIEVYNNNCGICRAAKNGLREIEMIISAASENISIREYIQDIRAILSETEVIDFAIFVGKEVMHLSEIRTSFESVKHLEEIGFYENKSIFIFEDYENTKFSEYIFDIGKIKKVVDAIRESDYTAVEDFCEVIAAQLVRPEIVCQYINKIIMDMIDQYCDDGNEAVSVLYRWSTLKKNTHITIDTVHSFLIEITDEFRKILEKKKKKSKLGIVGDVMEYINKNYANKDLNLQSVAKVFYIRAAYLGRLFKEKTGIRFNDYLMQIRIEHAKHLLRNSEHKVYEIADMVGFRDSNYFHARFSQIVNMSPVSYREHKDKE